LPPAATIVMIDFELEFLELISIIITFRAAALRAKSVA
jgi:hypothetical protein